MSQEKQAEFLRLYSQTLEAAQALHNQAEEVYTLAKDLEELTRDTP
jgi:hypothetical protein